MLRLLQRNLDPPIRKALTYQHCYCKTSQIAFQLLKVQIFVCQLGSCAGLHLQYCSMTKEFQNLPQNLMDKIQQLHTSRGGEGWKKWKILSGIWTATQHHNIAKPTYFSFEQKHLTAIVMFFQYSVFSPEKLFPFSKQLYCLLKYPN